MYKLIISYLLLSNFMGFSQQKSTGIISLSNNMTVNLTLDNSSSQVTMVLTGPSDRWFALQFGSFGLGQGMANNQDFVYFNGTTLVDGKMIGEVVPVNDPVQNWTLESNSVNAGIRTLVAKRSFSTGNSDDYTFNFNNTSIDFAWARSNNASQNMTSYHGFTNRGYTLSNSLVAVLSDNQDYLERSFRVYPNPSQGSFKIESKTKLDNINVYSQVGEFLKSINLTSHLFQVELDLKNFPKGTYFVEMQSGNNKVWEKIVLE